jgi:GWxTD domain-containing protein
MTFSKNFRRGTVLFLFTILICSLSFAQKQKFFINADFANFRLDKDTTYLEFYYSFNQSQFKLVKTGNEHSASAIMSLTFKSKKNDSVVLFYRWRVPMKITDTSSAGLDHPLVSVQGFKLPFGEYTALVSCYDENNSLSIDSLQYDLKSRIPSDKIAVSDIQLSSQIQQVPKDEKNVFYKNTLEVIPHPSGIYGIGLPIMFLYIEAYNLTLIKSDSFKYTAQVFDATGENLKKTSKNRKKVNESAIEVSTINCSDLPSGTYVVKCTFCDIKDTTYFVSTARKFYVYNPQVAPAKTTKDVTSMVSNEYAIKNEEEINREFEMLKYVALAKEKEQFASLTTLESKRVFMMNFWNNRDQDNDPAMNIFKEKFQKGIKYVNQTYRTGQKEGWKTDRGRVYLMYGPPSETERYPNETGTKPYEIWNYNELEGGVKFVFVDRSGMGDYILIHSTARNELSDSNWESKLK